ncbi:hypothetical protein C8Q73DRAFT_795404 [Cubamyces lactineus]|nr:hypothetical protein C8Q73DRAFT_795404 [Cubamyces lactineus]
MSTISSRVSAGNPLAPEVSGDALPQHDIITPSSMPEEPNPGQSTPKEYKVVINVSLSWLTQSHTIPTLNLTDSATIGRVRLIDCDQYLEHDTLVVHEFFDFPTPNHPYAALSYVWRGNAVDESTVGPRFSVAGAADGDPVGILALKHACAAARRYGVKYLWLDRLCIMQTSKDDKAWQITQMFRIYKESAASIVFPGGIQRLMNLDEPTTWINRGWTLQEALAPPRVEVVYAWRHGSGMYHGVFRGDIRELVPGQSAITPLRELLALNGFRSTTFFPSSTGTPIPFRTTIFGLPTDASDARPVVPDKTTEVVIFMLKNALASGGETFDERAPAIWRSALFRASSRPVDMVFSIMGLFGVALDPREFRADDRLGATLTLMRAILAREGGKASWLSLAPYLPPHPRLSTFPVFPKTSVDGRVELELVPPGVGGSILGQKLSESVGLSKRRAAILDTRRIRMPTGSMDEAGYLRISRKAVRIHALSPAFPLPGEGHHAHLESSQTAGPPLCCLAFRAIDGTGWRFYDLPEDVGDVEDRPLLNSVPKNNLEPRTLAVLVGWHNEFSLEGQWMGPRFLNAMLVREHAPEMFHVVSYFELSYKLERWVDGWEEMDLRIGGPGNPRHMAKLNGTR